MDNVSFCTITTHSHLYKVYALADSIMPYKLHVLLIDSNKIPLINKDNIAFVTLNQIINDLSIKIIDKYSTNANKLRWGLKPVFLSYLLNHHVSVIYLDNDILFYADPAFLFEKLSYSSVLLTPHFYETNPNNNQNWFEANYRVGLFNAGFIGVNFNALGFLKWWSNCCLYNIKKSFTRGLFDDQKYLDLVPILFDNVEILKHPGCNFAGWNYKNYQLDRNQFGEILINNQHKIIFIHYAELSCIVFSKIDNPLLPEYNYYNLLLKQYNAKYSFKRKIFNINTFITYLYFLIWKFKRLFE